MASAADVTELKAELERMKAHSAAKEDEFDGYFKILHANVLKYDLMSKQLDQLNDDWTKEVQDRIVETEAKQAIANAAHDSLCHEAEVSPTETHALYHKAATDGKRQGQQVLSGHCATSRVCG